MRNKWRNWFSKYIFQDIIDMIFIPPIFKDGKLLYPRGTRFKPCKITTRPLEESPEEPIDKLENKNNVEKQIPFNLSEAKKIIANTRWQYYRSNTEYTPFSERPITRKEADYMLKRILGAINKLEEKIDKLCPKE